MITVGNTPTDGNDPLQEAYQRLQKARENCEKSDLNTCPLDELTILAEELKAAKEGFDKALEHDQQTNTITVGHTSIWKRAYEALESLAKLNGIDIEEVLHGIEVTENGRITEASFTNLGLTDISPLAQLTQLERLLLNGNQIQDISSLAHLTQLKGLGLENNEIQDISPLSHLNELMWLLLSDNQIQDISPLAHLTQLTELSLRDNQIQDSRENEETLKKLDQQAPGHGGTFHRDTF